MYTKNEINSVDGTFSHCLVDTTNQIRVLQILGTRCWNGMVTVARDVELIEPQHAARGRGSKTSLPTIARFLFFFYIFSAFVARLPMTALYRFCFSLSVCLSLSLLGTKDNQNSTLARLSASFCLRHSSFRAIFVHFSSWALSWFEHVSRQGILSKTIILRAPWRVGDAVVGRE